MCVIIIVIIILSLCIACVFRYHYKNKQSQLGKRLRRTFSKDPEAVLRRYDRRDPSPIQLEAQHFQGTDTPPILYTDTMAQVVNENHLLGPSDQQQIYNYSQNSDVSGVSNYSGLSGVSQKKGPHHMPHFKEPSVVYQQGSNLVPVHLGVPPGPLGGNVNNPMVLTDGQDNRPQSRISALSEHIQHHSPHMLPTLYSSGGEMALQPNFISRNDLATIELALMQNKNCQIPGCCCYRVREIMEYRGYQHAPYNSPDISNVYSRGSGNSSSREQRIGHQPSSTDSDSAYGSSSDRRSRPLNLRLLSDKHNRNPNLHPHFHLTTKSYLHRVSVQAPVDYRRSKSFSDLTALTEVPKTPAKASAIGGIIKPDTPVYNYQPVLGEESTDETNRDDCTCPSRHPALLREISISADNIPTLSLNDCPFTPSPLKERRHLLVSIPGRLRRKSGSFERRSIRNVRPNLKTLKEKTSSNETDISKTSSHTNSPVKSSISDNEIITDSKQGLPTPERGPSPHRRRSASATRESSVKSNINQSPYFNEAKSRAQVPFLDHHVLECDSSGKEYTSSEHDIALKIPEGAVAAGEKIHLEVGVAMFGPFSFPDGTQPISPILWLCPLEESIQLKKPLQIVLPHFLTSVTRDRLLYHQICLAKASHNNLTFHDQQTYYEFQSYDATPLFAARGKKGYGMILIHHFCFYCLLAKQTPELATDAGYCLVRVESSLTPQRTEIFFSVVYFLDTCLKVELAILSMIM